MTDLYRLVYTSRDLAGGEDGRRAASVVARLEAWRRNNGRAGVTGALLLGGGGFAQVLEGPRAAVEATFARIRHDARHDDIGVLQCEFVADRLFAEWPMACVERPADGRADRDGFALDGDFGRVGVDGLCAALLALVRSGRDDASAAPAGFRSTPAPRPGGPERDVRPALDVDRLRSALHAERPDLRAAPGRVGTGRPTQPRPPASDGLGLPPDPAPKPLPPAAGCDAEQRALRPALDAERERTHALRRDLDEAHIALVRAAGDAEALERHRDIWADRSSQLRATLERARGALRAAESERDALRQAAAVREGALDALRLERDIWADRARALAAAFCRDPAAGRDEAASAERARPLPERGRAASIKVAR